MKQSRLSTESQESEIYANKSASTTLSQSSNEHGFSLKEGKPKLKKKLVHKNYSF